MPTPRPFRLPRTRLARTPQAVALAASLLAMAALACVAPGGKAPAADLAAERRLENPWFASGRQFVATSAPLVHGQAPARNVILFVGDGMGVSTVTAARILAGQRAGKTGEEHRLAFETLPHVALSKTYNVDAQVSDSASTMTALVSGVKTLTGVLGVDERIERGNYRSVAAARVATLFEEAEARGLSTGVVSTATITHATPAGCYAHVPFRFWESDQRMPEDARAAGFPDIARQLVGFPDGEGDGLEVALGGGRAQFLPKGAPDPEHPEAAGVRRDGRDLTREWQEARDGAAYVWNRAQFEALDPAQTRHLLGLFEPDQMNFEADRARDPAGEPSLAEMTAKAIELLSRNADGFVLMVEGGRIDHGHHVGNAYRALGDTIAFSDAVAAALAATSPAETLIVVTADHSHTLTISGYPKRGNPILGKVVGFDWIRGGVDAPGRDALDLPYTTLSYANGPGFRGPGPGVGASGDEACSHGECGTPATRGVVRVRPDLTNVDTEAPDFLQEATVGMRTETHAGEDVPVYAGGPRAALFHGVLEQHAIYHAMVEALGWTRAGRRVD